MFAAMVSAKKEAELLETVIARREYNAAVWKAREEFDRQKLAEQDELAKQKELARQEKLARKAELTRQQKLARQEYFDKQKELAEQELDGSLARQAELAKQKELARQELGLEMEKALRDRIAGEDCGEAVDPEKKVYQSVHGKTLYHSVRLIIPDRTGSITRC